MMCLVIPLICTFAFLAFAFVSPVRAGPTCTGFTKSPTVVKLDPATVYVRDGDTIQEHRECATGLRFNDIDAPDRGGKEKCPEEGALGDKAYERLLFMIRAARTAEFHTSGKADKWGRQMGQLYLDGKAIGPTLVNEKLACFSKDGAKEDWCAEPFQCSAG